MPEEVYRDEVHYVYILLCSDGTFYTGYSNDVLRRLATHNKGKGAKYTKTRLPCQLLYTEAYSSKSEALKREYHIKHRMNRKQKEALIRKGDMNEDREA